MRSIIFVLGSVLRVVELLPDVNEPQELGVLLREENSHLNLADRFEQFFQQLAIGPSAKFHLILLKNSGFTDSRIVYLWLKGEEVFQNSQLLIHTVSEEVELVTKHDFSEVLQRFPGSNELHYTREPSIGKV